MAQMASEKASAASPRDVHTYHCLCTNLLLASTRPLSALSRRSALDQAFILPLPPPPRPSHANDTEQRSSEYALLLMSTTLDRNPVVIRCSAGFEKRYLQRCGRCGLVVGYQLDKSQFESETELGRKDDIVYLLPGGLLSTDDIAAGKDMSNAVSFQGVNTEVSTK